MEDIKQKVKTRGVAALLEDREQFYTEAQLRTACKAAVFEASRHQSFTADKVDEIAEQAVSVVKNSKTIPSRL
jgi:hypothetical protein